MVHCVASIDMLAGGGGCGSAVSAFPDADLFMTHAAALHSLGELSFFVLAWRIYHQILFKLKHQIT